MVLEQASLVAVNISLLISVCADFVGITETFSNQTKQDMEKHRLTEF